MVMSFLSGCITIPQGDGPPDRDIRASRIPNAIPKAEPKSLYGNPSSYTVLGQHYYVLPNSEGYSEVGQASWYGMKFQHHLTSNREDYNLYKMTAAHRTLPLPTYARVTNLENNRQVIVRINDRGPFVKNRIIDLSYMAAKKLGILKKGTARVRVEAITPSHSPTKREIYLQLGVYSHLTNAKKMLQRVERLSHQPCKIYSEKTKDHSIIYKVQIGPIHDDAMADQLAVRIRSAGLPRPVSVMKRMV